MNLQVDLNKHVNIPKDILQTSLRPDLVVTSEKKRILGMMELTVPYEDRIEVSQGGPSTVSNLRGINLDLVFCYMGSSSFFKNLLVTRLLLINVQDGDIYGFV